LPGSQPRLFERLSNGTRLENNSQRQPPRNGPDKLPAADVSLGKRNEHLTAILLRLPYCTLYDLRLSLGKPRAQHIDLAEA